MGSTVVIIIAITVGSLLLIAIMSRVATAAISSKVRATIAARFPNETIVLQDEMANHLGLTSKGPIQVRRGNGGLVLTRDALYFLPLIGEDMRIALADVTGVSIVKSHLGKTIFRPLLKVEWAEDSVAFFVRDVAAWTRALPATLTASRAKPSAPPG